MLRQGAAAGQLVERWVSSSIKYYDNIHDVILCNYYQSEFIIFFIYHFNINSYKYLLNFSRCNHKYIPVGHDQLIINTSLWATIN